MRSIPFLLSLQLFLCPFVFARAGGGQGDGGDAAVGAGAAVLGGIGLLIFHLRRQKLINKAKKDLEEAESKDPSWDLADLKSVTEKTFYAYQNGWTRQNLELVRDDLHIDYYKIAKLKIQNQIDSGERNILKEINLDNQELISVRDVIGQDGDMFVMEMTGRLIDYTIRVSDGAFLRSPIVKKDRESFEDYSRRAQNEYDTFQELWVFMRVNKRWKLWDIKQEGFLIKDLIGLSQEELKKVLKREKDQQAVDDSDLYNK